MRQPDHKNQNKKDQSDAHLDVYEGEGRRGGARRWERRCESGDGHIGAVMALKSRVTSTHSLAVTHRDHVDAPQFESVAHPPMSTRAFNSHWQWM